MTNKLGSILSDEIGKVSAKTNWSKFHDHINECHDNTIDVSNDFSQRRILPAIHGNRDTCENGGNNAGEHIGTAENFWKIIDSECFDKHFSSGNRFCKFNTLHGNLNSTSWRENIDHNENNSSCKKTRCYKCEDKAAQDFP